MLNLMTRNDVPRFGDCEDGIDAPTSDPAVVSGLLIDEAHDGQVWGIGLPASGARVAPMTFNDGYYKMRLILVAAAVIALLVFIYATPARMKHVAAPVPVSAHGVPVK